MISNIRRTSRAIILNASNQILLIKINDKPLQDKSNRDQSSFWVTVGGEVEENESVVDALQRELREEVGFIKPAEFELIAFGEQILPWKGLSTQFIEKFYIVRTEEINLDNRNLTGDELKVIAEYRWWSIDELLNTKEVVFPGCLAKLMKDYINSSDQWVAQEITLD
jgi:ADP-ribose pyrophosphatase YjhB (NUDIX family)